jgi:hypothetical protein
MFSLTTIAEAEVFVIHPLPLCSGALHAGWQAPHFGFRVLDREKRHPATPSPTKSERHRHQQSCLRNPEDTMSKDALISEMRAAAASMVTAVAAAENEDWPAAESGLMDAQERGSRLLRELSIMQGSQPQSDTAIPGVPPIPVKPE